MKRVTVNFDDRTGKLVEDAAAREKRSISNYIVLLAERDIGMADNPDARAEILATVEELGVGAAAQVLGRAVRRKRRNTAA
jgi:hypothetical protein